MKKKKKNEFIVLMRRIMIYAPTELFVCFVLVARLALHEAERGISLTMAENKSDLSPPRFNNKKFG